MGFLTAGGVTIARPGSASLSPRASSPHPSALRAEGATGGEAATTTAAPAKLEHVFAPTTGSGTVRSFGGLGGTLLSCATPRPDYASEGAHMCVSAAGGLGGEDKVRSMPGCRMLRPSVGVATIADVGGSLAMGSLSRGMKRPASAMSAMSAFSTVSSAGSTAGLNITVKSTAQRTA